VKKSGLFLMGVLAAALTPGLFLAGCGGSDAKDLAKRSSELTTRAVEAADAPGDAAAALAQAAPKSPAASAGWDAVLDDFEKAVAEYTVERKKLAARGDPSSALWGPTPLSDRVGALYEKLDAAASQFTPAQAGRFMDLTDAMMGANAMLPEGALQ
jgi:outer membrane murein-binding lipoprotein Lpp